MDVHAIGTTVNLVPACGERGRAGAPCISRRTYDEVRAASVTATAAEVDRAKGLEELGEQRVWTSREASLRIMCYVLERLDDHREDTRRAALNFDRAESGGNISQKAVIIRWRLAEGIGPFLSDGEPRQWRLWSTVCSRQTTPAPADQAGQGVVRQLSPSSVLAVVRWSPAPPVQGQTFIFDRRDPKEPTRDPRIFGADRLTNCPAVRAQSTVSFQVADRMRPHPQPFG